MPTQTFLDLYREMKARKYRKQDLELVFRAHDLATRIFSGSYRPTYKPFTCHLVGTASVLAQSGERGEVIAAALLHSAYPLGEFGDGTRDVTAEKRAVVSQVVGAEAEELIHQYCIADWRSFESFDDAPGSPLERDLWALKFADLFDDFSDNTMKIVPNKGMVMHPSRNAALRAKLINCATRTLGPAIATEFDSMFDKIEHEDIDDFLINQRVASFFENRKPLTRPTPSFGVSISRRIKKLLRVQEAPLRGFQSPVQRDRTSGRATLRRPL
jgi:hypothetical protein